MSETRHARIVAGQCGGGCEIRTREGLPPTRFPTMLTGVHRWPPRFATCADAAVPALQRARASHAAPPARAAPPAGAAPSRSLRSRRAAILALALSRAVSAASRSAPAGESW